MKKLFLVCLLAATVGTAWAQWAYTREKDAMTDAVQLGATLKSTNQFAFKFPYQGGTSEWFNIQQSVDGPDFVIGVMKGQIMTTDDILVRFDDAPPLTFDAAGAASGSTKIAFLKFPGCDGSDCTLDKQQFLSRLRNAKRMRVQATYYEQGQRVFEFKPAGLKWAE